MWVIRFGNVLLDAGMCRGELSTTTGVGRDAIPLQARTLRRLFVFGCFDTRFVF